jgi:hypothetical protein
MCQKSVIITIGGEKWKRSKDEDIKRDIFELIANRFLENGSS